MSGQADFESRVYYEDEDRMKQLEVTKNEKGFMFAKPGVSADFWLGSVPSSSLPLLDLGSAYGVHTFHAMKAGRDVIAVDLDPDHIRILRGRAKNLVANTSSDEVALLGRLVDTIIARLPNASLFPSNSFSGILLSEVLHFMRPGEPLEILRNAFNWLCPGGRVVVTCLSGANLELIADTGFKFQQNRTVEQVRELLASEEEDLIAAAPTFGEVPDGPMRAAMGEYVYLMTTNELGVIAKRTGFIIERLSYIQSGKYPFRAKDPNFEEDAVLLVAHKPLKLHGVEAR